MSIIPDISSISDGIDHVVRSIMEACGIPDLAAGIVKDGELVYARGFRVKIIQFHFHGMIRSSSE